MTAGPKIELSIVSHQKKERCAPQKKKRKKPPEAAILCCCRWSIHGSTNHGFIEGDKKDGATET